jgi:hypothetical protein
MRVAFQELSFTQNGQPVQEEGELELLTNSGSEGLKGFGQ